MKRLFFISGLCLAFFTSCIRLTDVEGNNDNIKQFRHLQSSFNGIELQSSFDLEIIEYNSDTIIVEAESNLQKLILTELRSGRIIIKTPLGKCIKPHGRVKIYCKTNALQNVSVTGSGAIYSNNLSCNETSYSIEGSGNINIIKSESTKECKVEGSGSIDIDSIYGKNIALKIDGSGDISTKKMVCTSTNIDICGSGNIRAKGSSKTTNIEINSSGDFSDFTFITDSCTATINGSGSIKLFVLENLNATIKGSGSILYDGNPTVYKKIWGSGTISKR